MLKQKYQFYICSTYEELIEERKIITNILLNLQQIPSIGEHTFSTCEFPFETMKKFIDEADCMILIIGEEYGKIYKNGISYIEAEYNYALEKNKPVICLVKNIINKKVTKELDNFKNRLFHNAVMFWNNTEDFEFRSYSYLYQWLYNNSLNNKTKRNIDDMLNENKTNNIKDEELLLYQESLKNTLGLYTTKENNDIIGLMVNNLSEIKQFYKLTKDQADNAYKLAKNSSIAGIILIMVAVLIALFFSNNQIAIATTVGGVVVEVLAGTSLFVYQKTLKQLNYYYASLHNNERFLSLINIVGKTNIKDELYSKIVESELDNLKQYEIKNENTQ